MKFITIFLACLLSISLYAQSGGNIIGVVTNGSKPLAGVTILLEGSTRGTITDEMGSFILTELQPGSYSLIFSFIGFEKQKIDRIRVMENHTTDVGTVAMNTAALSLKEVVVTPGQYAILGNAPLSRQTLTSEDIKNMSWAEDITRAVTRLPGVASNDFSSKFTVRGGEADEVLITLDGMELYEPFHQRDFAGGLFSIVDIETIQGIDLMTGGFSAVYGNRQSAVFTMNTKQVQPGEKHTALGLSVMNARAYTDGTFSDGKASYMVSARRGMLDQVFKLIGEDETIPNFYDMMGKVEYKFSPKHSLSLYGIHAGDKTAIRDISEEAFDIHDTSYKNSYVWATWKAAFNEKLFARTIAYTGIVSHERNGSASKDEYSDKLQFELQDNRKYTLTGIKQDWNWDVADRLILNMGWEAKQVNADYDYNYSLKDIRINSMDSLVNFADSVDIVTSPGGQQTAAYISARFRVLPKVVLETGLRHDYTSYSDDNLLSPRVGFSVALAECTFLRGGWGYYYQSQFINNLDVNHGNSTFNPAELSEHYVLGLEHTLNNGINVRLEGYYKDISRLSPTFENLRDPWEVFPESRNDVVKITYDGAAAKGIELFMKYDMGKKFSWWFSYALASATENVTDLEFEGLLTPSTGKLPRINNQQNTVYVDLNYRPNSKWHLNLSWVYYDGLPMTLYTYEIQETTGLSGTQLPLHFYPRHFTFRQEEIPAYHRMDVRANRQFQLNKGQLVAFLHLVNVYNRENLRKFDLDATDDDENLAIDDEGNYLSIRDDKYWFGFMPVFGVVWEF